MNSYLKKTTKSTRQSTLNSLSSKSDNGAGSRLMDNRPAAVTQTKLQKAVSDNRHVQKTEGKPTIQMQVYDGSVKIKTKVDPADMSDWGVVRSKLDGVVKGGDAYDIGSKVNDSLGALGLTTGEAAMSAHMIPNRIGGAGNATNVRPWKSSFEGGTWESNVEQAFDQEIPAANVGDTISYKVTTKDMDGSKAQEIVDTSTVLAEKTQAHHKERIQKIPLAVSATVGSKNLAETAEPFDSLIKGY